MIRITGLASLAAAVIAFVSAPPLSARTQVAESASDISAVGTFYTDYEHFTVRALVGFHPGCVKDEYGFYDNPACDDVDSNDADYDVHIYQTYPRWRLVHAERDHAFRGRDSLDLYWDFDLHAPDCYGGSSWSRRYKAVFRLFDPVSGNITARDTETFGVKCS